MNAKDASGWTVLHDAAIAGNLDVVTALVEAGASAGTARGDVGGGAGRGLLAQSSPLMWAAISAPVRVARAC